MVTRSRSIWLAAGPPVDVAARQPPRPRDSTSSTSSPGSSRACRRRRKAADAAAGAGVVEAAAVVAAARAPCSRATAARSTSDRGQGSSRRRCRAAAEAAAASGGGRWRRPRGRTRRGRRSGDAGARDGQRDRASDHVHREHPGRSSRAALAGLRRGLAHHEEPLLRRRDARRRLERCEVDVRAAAQLPRRRGRAAHRHDDDDRPAQRVAHRRERRAVGHDLVAGADAPSRLHARARSVRLLQGRRHLQDGPRRSRLHEDQARRFRDLDRRSRSEDVGQLLAVLHARVGQQVPLPAERQGGEGRRVGAHD